MTQTKNTKYDVAIIGAGPAGLMAAGAASARGLKVIIIEKNAQAGKKLLITGGSRCNLTNAEFDTRKFLSKFGDNGKFLFSPFSVFGIQDSIDFFNKRGVETKVEPGNRVFPVSDKAEDILKVLLNYADGDGQTDWKFKTTVSDFIVKAGKIVGVKTDTGEILADSFILGTGGMSHQETGSTGDGFVWLEKLGCKVNTPQPSLVPMKTAEKWVGDLSGLSLDWAGITVCLNDEVLSKRQGKVLFTHFGLSGPGILNSSRMVGDNLDKGVVTVKLDLFPGIGLDVLEAEVKQLIEDNLNKKVGNLSWPKVSSKLLQTIISLSFIDSEKQVNAITREERRVFIDLLKSLPLTITGLLGFEDAIISSGGIDSTEVDFKTMQTKLFPNLYVVGDVLDFDRPSGGFSLQLAWTTGYVAGISIRK